LDDDFDTDNGYSGKVQFAIGFRDSSIADISGSNGFESDNDAGGSTSLPQTSAVFSNITLVGPRATLNTIGNSNFKRGIHARRNSAISVFNSIIMGWPTGWSAAGLHMLTHDVEAVHAVHAMALNEFRAPSLDYGIDFSRASALTDTSDALFLSCQSIAEASGVNLHIDPVLIESAYEFKELSLLAQSLGVDVFEWILGGGEDHVFLATGVDLPGIRIGDVRQGSGVTGLEMKKAPQMWRHFQ